MMLTSSKGLNVCADFEGESLRAYKCPADVWTIGRGNTNADGFTAKYLGKPIGPGVTISPAQSAYLFVESIRKSYEPAVRAAMPNAKQAEFDAGIDFHFNTGAIARASWVKYFRSGDRGEIGPTLLSWNKGGGKVLAGLTRRRKRELAMILSGDYGPEGNRPYTDSKRAQSFGMLRLGDKGPECADLNAALAKIGFKTGTQGEYFTAVTQDAILKFQTAHKQLRVDGVAGPATRAAIQRERDGVRQTTGAGGTIATEVITGAGDHLAGGYLPLWLWVALGAALFCALAYVAWKYRDELVAKLSR